MYKIIPIILLVSVIVVSGCASSDSSPKPTNTESNSPIPQPTQNAPNTPQLTNNSQVNECIKDNSYLHKSEFLPSQILVYPNMSISNDDFSEFINSLGLAINTTLGSGTKIIEVPKGQEIEWMCKFEESFKDKVRSAYLNMLLVAY